ncbi:MAG: sulfotransferase family 2 domain-containing protein [Planctomycetia bacterium]
MSRLTRFIRSLPAFPESAWRHSLLPLQQPGFPVAVCWSAKSGCTTVLKWFLAQTGLLDEAFAYSRWVHDYREHKLFPSPDYLRQCDRIFRGERDDLTVIKVIRDPATRAVSSFLHFLRCSRGAASWPTAAEANRWKAATGLGSQPGLSFRQFLLFIADRQRHRPAVDVHVRPQYDATQDRRVDASIRLEDLAAGLASVEEQHGLPHVDVRRLSLSDHHNPASADHDWPTVAATFAADHATLDERGTPPARIFLDPETRALIQSVFAVDYAAYGDFYGAASPTLRKAA